jgi:L-threonylcarbamoyladenylate synthase
MTSQVRIRCAAAHVQSGGVVACPAEAVWGLSCDPWSRAAVEQLCDMKQRPISKGVIVASGDVADFAPLLDGLTGRPTTGRFRFVAWPCYLAGAAQKLFPVLGDGREH